MTRIGSPTAACVAALLAAACAGTPADRGILAVPRPLPEFAAIDAVAHGEGAGGTWTGADLRVGDEAWFGLVLQNGDARRQWLVRFRVRGAPGSATVVHRVAVNDRSLAITSRLVAIAVDVFDAHGAPESGSLSSIGDSFLTTGLYATARIGRERGLHRGMPPVRFEDAEAEQFARGVLSLTMLFEAVRANESLSPILWQVVETPSVLSVIGNLGVSVSLDTDLEHAVFDGEPVLDSGPTCVVPVTVEANGSPALLSNLFCVPPRGPFVLAGGIVAIEAVHPTDESRRFSMRLLRVHRPR